MWDWNWLFYLGTVVLQMDERVFWRSTPRKLLGLWSQHKLYHGMKEAENEQTTGFIDQVPW